MVQLPLLDANLLAENMKALGPDILAALQAAAEAFVNDNRQDALAVGDENAKAIMLNVTYVTLPIAPLSADASVKQIADHEAVLVKRDQLLQLISQAQKENNEHQRRLYAAAGKAASSVVIGILGMTLKALLGG